MFANIRKDRKKKMKETKAPYFLKNSNRHGDRGEASDPRLRRIYSIRSSSLAKKSPSREEDSNLEVSKLETPPSRQQISLSSV